MAAKIQTLGWVLVIYRKRDGKAPKLTKAEMSRAVAILAATVRTPKPETLAFLADRFYSMPVCPRLIDRVVEGPKAGWVVPLGESGRDAVVAALQAGDVRSAVNSYNAWIIKNASHLVNPDHFLIVAEQR